MLSILIPIYNYNAVSLVRNLHQQANKENIDFEILLLDDASDNTCHREENAVLKELSKTKLFDAHQGEERLPEIFWPDGTIRLFNILDCDSER